MLLVCMALAAVLSPARAELVIGVAAPFSGQPSPTGPAMLRAAEWAAEAINAQGGIGGDKLVVVAEDDGCDDRRAATAAAALAARKPALVVGHPCGSAALAAARVYAAAGVLYIAAAPRHPDLSRRRAGPSVLRLAGRDDHQSAATAAYLLAAYVDKRLAIVHDRTRYARTLVEGVKSRLAAAGAPAPPEFGIVAGNKDYAAAVAGVAAHHAEVVYFAGFPAEAAVVWARMREAGLSPDLVGSDALANARDDLQAIKSGANAIAVRAIRPFTAAEATTAAPLVARLASAGLAASADAVAGYAAIEAWAQAAREAGAIEPLALARRLAGAPLPTLIGPVAFDGAGDAIVPSFAVATVEGAGLAVEAIVMPSTGTEKRAGLATPAIAEPAAINGAGRPPPLPARHPRRLLPRAGATRAP